MIGPQSTRVCYICAKACVGWTVLFLGSGVVRLLRRCLEGVAEERAVTPGPAEQARPTGNSQIAGCVFNGRNRNGTFDKNEPRMSRQTVTLVDPETGDIIEYTLTFQPPTGAPKPAKLTYIGQRLTTIDVPFVLKDVPLP